MDESRQGTNDRFDAIRSRTEIARGAVARWQRRLQGALDRLPDPAQLQLRSDRDEAIATALLAAMKGIARGSTKAQLTLWTATGPEPLELALDPAKPVRDQAEALMKSARRTRREARIVPQRREALEREREDADQAEAILAVEPADARLWKAREAMLVALEVRLTPRGLWPVPPRVADEPPRRAPVRWSLPGGWILLAGRSGAENDFLTTRIARSEDLWFHVANVPGAHVVLRSPDGRSGTPPPELVERAASLAAWLSRLRAQESVEVRWTERKRVRKPRKAPAGTVVMDQARSILVHPAPPPT